MACVLGVSKQVIWLWIGQYNQEGSVGLECQRRGGRRRSLLEFKEEQRVLERWANGAQQGEVILDIFLQKPWSQMQPCPHHQRSSHENLCP